MGEEIKVYLEELSKGGTFDGDELIVFLDRDRMETVRQDQIGEDDIDFSAYDVKRRSSSVHHNGGCEIVPGETEYIKYHSMLVEAKLWW